MPRLESWLLSKQAIDQRMNMLVSGGTSSGKTTVARALLSLTHRAERLVTIEDARQLTRRTRTASR